MSGDIDQKSWTHIHGWVVVVLLPHFAKDFVACEERNLFGANFWCPAQNWQKGRTKKSLTHIPELKTEVGYSANIVRTYIPGDICPHNIGTMSALCPHNISRRIYVGTMSAQCQHNVRTMSALCPHNIS